MKKEKKINIIENKSSYKFLLLIFSFIMTFVIMNSIEEVKAVENYYWSKSIPMAIYPTKEESTYSYPYEKSIIQILNETGYASKFPINESTSYMNGAIDNDFNAILCKCYIRSISVTNTKTNDRLLIMVGVDIAITNRNYTIDVQYQKAVFAKGIFPLTVKGTYNQYINNAVNSDGYWYERGALFINTPPTNRTTIPAQTISGKGQSIKIDFLGNYFSDIDWDILTYTTNSNVPSKVTAVISGNSLVLNGIEKGTASITLTATDPYGASVSQTFTTTVNNTAPMIKTAIPSQIIESPDTTISLNLTNYFQDIDNDNLTYTASSNKITTSSVNEGILSLTGVKKGIDTITVTATDTSGATITQTFTVEVLAKEVLRNAVIHFNNSFTKEVNPKNIVFTPHKPRN